MNKSKITQKSNSDLSYKIKPKKKIWENRILIKKAWKCYIFWNFSKGLNNWDFKIFLWPFLHISVWQNRISIISSERVNLDHNTPAVLFIISTGDLASVPIPQLYSILPASFLIYIITCQDEWFPSTCQCCWFVFLTLPVKLV
jgi:hypothetical protein